MKKYTIQEVAKLLADKTHAVYDDGNTTLDILVKILKLAFPKDEETDTFEFTKEDPYYGYCRHDSDNWANIGRYLEQLEIINLSDVLKENEVLINDIKVNASMHVETVTISKEDYDRFLKLEKKAKKSDQKFIDKCAISAMQTLFFGSIEVKAEINFIEAYDYVSKNAYLIAKSMLTERNKNR